MSKGKVGCADHRPADWILAPNWPIFGWLTARWPLIRLHVFVRPPIHMPMPDWSERCFLGLRVVCPYS